jgi:hypothetical protein
MSDPMTEIIFLLERHAERLHEDIRLCRTRDEHIRVTARTNEAFEILKKLTATLSND